MNLRTSNWLILISIGFAILPTACGKLTPPDQNENLPAKQNMNAAASPSPVPSETPTVTPEEIPTVTPELSPTSINSNISGNVNLPVNSSSNFPAIENTNSSGSSVGSVTIDKLIIPVAGIKPESLVDTFNAARSEGRVHDAIDIMAPGGTPILAAVDGEIARFFDSEKGGITIYQFSRDKKLIYYYAHLQRRADEIQEHQFVKQGTVIGYVGDTGNAGAGNFHLHFAIWVINDPKHYWDGTNINPYPLLR